MARLEVKEALKEDKHLKQKKSLHFVENHFADCHFNLLTIWPTDLCPIQDLIDSNMTLSFSQQLFGRQVSVDQMAVDQNGFGQKTRN
jgi:hypothetical protein